jgi:hypothetical protein
MYSAVNLYYDDVVVDIITIRENQNFHLCLFVKVQVVTISFFFSKYSAWKVLKLYQYKGRLVLFCYQVLKYQLNFKSFRVIPLFAYLGQLGVISSLFVIFSLSEFPFLSSTHSLCCYHTLLEQS